MKCQPYRSCNCRECRMVNPKRKREHKKSSHRKLRRQERQAIRTGEYHAGMVETGYRA